MNVGTLKKFQQDPDDRFGNEHGELYCFIKKYIKFKYE